jgi:hypothetical protein
MIKLNSRNTADRGGNVMAVSVLRLPVSVAFDSSRASERR